MGVNINTASPSILKYISGLTTTAINKIIKYREEHGKITSRDEIKKKTDDAVKWFQEAIWAKFNKRIDFKYFD